MLPKDDKKKKDAGKSGQKDKDPVNKSGGKAKKKKWSKGKVRDKPNNLLLFDKATSDKLCREVPNYSVGLQLWSPPDWRSEVPWPGQPLGSYSGKDVGSWLQSTEPKELTPEIQRVGTPQLLVKMHEQIQSAAHLGK